MRTQRRLFCLTFVVLMLFTFCSSFTVFAENGSLNEIGGTTEKKTTTVVDSSTESSGGRVSKENEDSAAAVGELFKQGSLDKESVDKAAKWIEPVAKGINVLMAIILGIFSAVLVLISVVDMVYLGVPLVRPYLLPGGGAQPQGGAAPMGAGGMMGYGGGMMGRGMMGGGMMGAGMQQPQQQGVASTIGQLISDDAKHALMEAEAQVAPQGGGSPMMPGGFGMPQQQAAQPVKGKNLYFAYMKKRALTLVMLGVCLVLFTCTIFTDLGTMLGMKILALLSGVGL